MSRHVDIDLGSDHTLWFFGWDPDRELNPQYDAWPDPVDKCGAVIEHLKPDGSPCRGAVNFDLGLPVDHPLRKEGRPVWQVVSWEPLHIEPSVLCNVDKGGCGDHGFIREGRWVTA